MGYTKEFKRYYYYVANDQKVFVSLRAVIFEKKFLREETSASKVELNEVQ